MKTIFELDMDNKQELLDTMYTVMERLRELGEQINITPCEYNEKNRKDLNEEEIAAIRNNLPVKAIRLVKERLGITLHQARYMVLDYRKSMS